MEQIGDMKFVDFEEILERDLGKIGTPKRDEFERKVNETVKKEFSLITELFAVEKSRLLGFTKCGLFSKFSLILWIFFQIQAKSVDFWGYFWG